MDTPPFFFGSDTERLREDEVIAAIEGQQTTRPTRPVVPKVSFMSEEPSHRLVWEAPNSFRIEGTARHGGASCLVTVDGQTVKLTLRNGEGPLSVAYRLRTLLPPQYSATIRAGRPAVTYAVLTIWRRS